MVVVVALVVWLAYRENESTLVQAGGERARAAAEQIAALFERSTLQNGEQLRRAIEDERLIGFVQNPTPEHRSAAESLLGALTLGTPRRMTIWSLSGEVLLTVAIPDASGLRRELPPPFDRPPTGRFSPLQTHGPDVFVDSSMDVRGPPPAGEDAPIRLALIGSRTTFVANPPDAFKRLVGRDAVVLLGNVRGDVWSDLATTVPPPPIDYSRFGVSEYRTPRGESRIGALGPIRGTPWAIWVELPRSDLAAPARRFLRRLAILGALITFITALVVSTAAGRVMAPVSEITSAAEAMAAGDGSRRVAVTRQDEIGRLAQAFNAMTEQVEDTRRRLETQIIERTRMFDALSQNEARHRAIVEVAFDCIIMIDGRGIVTEFNPAAERTFGYSRAEAIGRELAELIVPPQLREAHRQALARYVASGEGTMIGKLLEMTAVRKDGTEFPVDLAISPVLWEGPLMMTGVIRDISGRKEAEAQLRQSQKMEAIGQLAGGVAHDFNNLLTAILGYSRLLADTIDPADARARDLNEIIGAAERAAGLTRQLLAFSRKQILEPTLVDVNAIVDGMSGMLRRLIGEHIDVTLRLTPTPGLIRADPTQIQQILMNLAVNARDAMPDGGRLSIETANVALDATYAMEHTEVEPGDYVMLAVTDSGVGMSEETRRRLFEPFYTTKGLGRGTGLGLATVYGIVKQTGGHIWVYSEPGHGAAFKVYLPRVDGVVAAAPPAAAPGSVDGTETVLLVEDEQGVRFLVRALLERSGYTVIDAESARDAIDAFDRCADAIDVLITDVIMPGGKGPALFERLSERRPSLKVLYMSGYTEDAVTRDGLLPPGIAFVQKPFNADEFLRKVRDALDRR